MIRQAIRLLAIGLATIFATATSHAATKVQFALDWKFEGPSAPYFLAIDNGHFAAADMDVEISPGKVRLTPSPRLQQVPFRSDLLISIR